MLRSRHRGSLIFFFVVRHCKQDLLSTVGNDGECVQVNSPKCRRLEIKYKKENLYWLLKNSTHTQTPRVAEIGVR